ncbi:hypothetical protein SESBI_48395 [Sesbania bispinosa]|nr:hypothetical protein SESBI_48395 [Sesbania bispinosa]
MTYATISAVQVGELDDWAGEIQADDKLRSIVQDLIANPDSHPGIGTPSSVDDVNQLLEERDAMLEELRANLLKAQDCMRVQANKHRRDVHYQVGDWVFLKLQPYPVVKPLPPGLTDGLELKVTLAAVLAIRNTPAGEVEVLIH